MGGLALDVIHLLREKGAEISYHDPYVPTLSVESVPVSRIDLRANALQTADYVVIITHYD